MNSPLPAAARAFPLAGADQCVKCGICVPHCPTYRITRHEGDSPRGRIALMQGLVTGSVPATDQLQRHLDGCLTCRACEAVCPAEVPYGRLIDSVRQVLAEIQPRRGGVQRMMGVVLVNKPLRFAVALILWAYQRCGLQWLLRRSRALRGRLGRLESLLPRIYLPSLPRPAAVAGAQSVALFANCTSPLVEPQTLEAAAALLSRVGCNVSVPPAQTCCGALHQHAGIAGRARRCAEQNVQAFAGAQAVVGIASGCGAQLLDYRDLLPGAADLAARSVDVHRFLAQHPNRAQLSFRPLAARVAVHSPCTLRNVLKDASHVRVLLAMVPGLEIRALESGCCGAAGSYFLTQPAMADRLLEPLLQQIAQDPPDYVLSSNIGCSMHLSAGLARAGVKVPVWHPARLLARQLAPAGSVQGPHTLHGDAARHGGT